MEAQPIQGTHVLIHEDRQPVLYDHLDRPLVREVGFRVESKPDTK